MNVYLTLFAYVQACVCMHMCVNVYIIVLCGLYLYVDTYAYKCIFVFDKTYAYVCMCTHVHVYLCVDICLYMCKIVST